MANALKRLLRVKSDSTFMRRRRAVTACHAPQPGRGCDFGSPSAPTFGAGADLQPASVTLVQINRSGVDGEIIRRAVDAGAAAVFEPRPDRERVAIAGEGDRSAELVIEFREVRSFDICLL